MSDLDLGSLSDQQLYDRYVASKIRLAEVYYRLRTYKRLFPELMKLTAEINSRGSSTFQVDFRMSGSWAAIR